MYILLPFVLPAIGIVLVALASRSALAECSPTDLSDAERSYSTARALSDAGQWAELGEVVSGTQSGRQGDGDLTFFKSVGIAVQDTMAAALVFAAAKAQGLGTEVDLS